MTDKEWSPGNVLDVFGDSIARATLVVASEQPVTAQDLAERLDVSCPTIYRRIGPLVDANLLRERQGIDQSGNQPSEYRTVLDEVTLAVESGEYEVDIRLRQDLAEDFESMWADLEQGGRVEGGPALRSTGSRDGDPDTT